MKEKSVLGVYHADIKNKKNIVLDICKNSLIQWVSYNKLHYSPVTPETTPVIVPHVRRKFLLMTVLSIRQRAASQNTEHVLSAETATR